VYIVGTAGGGVITIKPLPDIGQPLASVEVKEHGANSAIYKP
jgi:hypothetical protein